MNIYEGDIISNETKDRKRNRLDCLILTVSSNVVDDLTMIEFQTNGDSFLSIIRNYNWI